MTHLSLIDRMASCGNGAYGGPTISDRPYGGDDQQFYAAQRPSMIVKGPVPQSSHRARLNTLAAVAYLAVAKHTTTLAVILTALVIGGVIGFGWPAPGRGQPGIPLPGHRRAAAHRQRGQAGCLADS